MSCRSVGWAIFPCYGKQRPGVFLMKPRGDCFSCEKQLLLLYADEYCTEKGSWVSSFSMFFVVVVVELQPQLPMYKRKMPKSAYPVNKKPIKLKPTLIYTRPIMGGFSVKHTRCHNFRLNKSEPRSVLSQVCIFYGKLMLIFHGKLIFPKDNFSLAAQHSAAVTSCSFSSADRFLRNIYFFS